MTRALMRAVKWLGVMAVATCLSLSLAADYKYHSRIELEGEPSVGAFTFIGTLGEESPATFRVLYEDSEGELLVVRSSMEVTWGDEAEIVSFETSVEHLGSGEMISVSGVGNSLIVWIGDDSVTWTDSEDGAPAAVQQQALTLFASCPLAFQEAVGRLVVNGMQYSVVLSGIAAPIRNVLYGAVQFVESEEATTNPEERVADFDPYADPPSDFEEQFGQHYFE